MRGQWIGTYTGTSNGHIVVNVDEFPDRYEGIAYITPNDRNIPSVAVAFKTPDKQERFSVHTPALVPIDPRSSMPAPWASVKEHYPAVQNFSTYADVIGAWTPAVLSLSWSTDIGVKGACELARSKASEPSDLNALEMDWGKFKEYVAGLGMKRYLYRGQNKPWRLRTSFYREGRADLARFLSDDIQVLHRYLTARTRHVFNLQDSNENGAFFNLVQHHGYPTPLLDWTYSPYVAAFFAYRGISNEQAAGAAPTTKVRIHVFDQAQWKEDLPQIAMLLPPTPHLSIGEFIAIENERLVPQQGASTVTNVDDIESYIKFQEEAAHRQYLSAIDLPISDRKRVVLELGFMGITAGSMFPGLDGTCEELKERNFGV